MPNLFFTVLGDLGKIFKGSATVAEKFLNSFQKVFGKTPSAIHVVENFVNVAAPIVTTAVLLADPLLEPEVAGALRIVETGLAAIDASATAANSGQSLLANLQNFATTVPQLLTGVAIKNSNLQASVTKIVNLVVAECKVIIPVVDALVKKQATVATPAQ